MERSGQRAFVALFAVGVPLAVLGILRLNWMLAIPGMIGAVIGFVRILRYPKRT